MTPTNNSNTASKSSTKPMEISTFKSIFLRVLKAISILVTVTIGLPIMAVMFIALTLCTPFLTIYYLRKARVSDSISLGSKIYTVALFSLWNIFLLPIRLAKRMYQCVVNSVTQVYDMSSQEMVLTQDKEGLVKFLPHMVFFSIFNMFYGELLNQESEIYHRYPDEAYNLHRILPEHYNCFDNDYIREIMRPMRNEVDAIEELISSAYSSAKQKDGKNDNQPKQPATQPTTIDNANGAGVLPTQQVPEK